MLCFGKFPVDKMFMNNNGGGYQDFPSKVLGLRVPKSFVAEPLTVSVISGIEK